MILLATVESTSLQILGDHIYPQINTKLIIDNSWIDNFRNKSLTIQTENLYINNHKDINS